MGWQESLEVQQRWKPCIWDRLIPGNSTNGGPMAIKQIFRKRSMGQQVSNVSVPMVKKIKHILGSINKNSASR